MDVTLTDPVRPPRRWVGRTLRALGFTGGGFVSGLLAISYYIAHRITRPTRVTPFDSFTFTPFEVGIPYEAVTFPSAGEVELRGWWLYRTETHRVVIICTGYRGRRADMLGIAAALWRDGNNVLIFDYRGHGELAGTPVTLGFNEVVDLLAAVEWVKGRVAGAVIGVIGFSMGGSVAIMGAARTLDIRAIVADSPFARQRGVVAFTVKQVLRVRLDPILHVVDLVLGPVGGYHFSDVEPLREIALIAPRPVLLIHGECDSVCNPQDSLELYAAACEPKELWMSPGVEHCGTYFADRAYYCARIADFFKRTLSQPITAPESATAR